MISSTTRFIFGMALLTLGTQVLAEDSAKMLSAKLPDGCTVEVDVRSDETPACWRLQCTDAEPRKLGCDVTELHQIAEIKASPNGRWLALISVGEGHPILEIADLREWRKLDRYQSPCSVNPYPGTISMGEWQSGMLRIESDLDLTVTQDDRSPDDLGETRSYGLWPLGCELVD
jgi:hypothetical protein